MKTLQVSLASINDVKKFVSAACAQTFDIDVVAGRYILDAKSIMGIFSVDLSRPIRVDIHADEAEAAAFCEAVAPYVL